VTKGLTESVKGGEGTASSERPFEDSVKRLAEIVELLEAGDLPLEESVRLFEEGIRLSRSAQSKLDSAEKRVEELLGVSDDGEPVVRRLEE
jgi:exodeoxyribonuclease VII small subunit